MSKSIVDDARRTSHYLEALGSSRTTGETTSMLLLRNMAEQLEKLHLAVEPLVAEVEIWADAPSDAVIMALGPLPAQTRERATIGDLRMLRQQWFGGPEAEARAVAIGILQDLGLKDLASPIEGALDDLVDDWHARQARKVIGSGILGQAKSVKAPHDTDPAELEAEVIRTYASRAARLKEADIVDQASWLVQAGCPANSIAKVLDEAKGLALETGLQP